MSAPTRPPVRARSGRRPLLPIAFLLVLALVALAVWWTAFRRDRAREAAQAAACSTAAAAPPSLDPSTVSVRVLNASDTAGLAQQVAAELSARGFVVDEVANDPSGRRSQVTGVGELRHGPRGADAAAYLTLFLPGAGDFPDTRATAQVDLVIGPQFQGLAPPAQVRATLASVANAEEAC